MGRSTTREKIVDAAMEIVRTQGAARLTLDEAARVAGVSKGGVLYHFKCKDDLIRAMVSRLIEQNEALCQRYYHLEPEGPYRWARTIVRAAFDPQGAGNDPAGAAILAATALNPNLLEPIRGQFFMWNERLRSDSPDPDRALLISMAMDGLFLDRVTGMLQYDAAQLDRLQASSLALLI
ncbi:TetR family transcriptional regulator [Rhodospirillum rubrum]|uniref:TetR/AcrR family transcriptional regulator n=1 Tax=Rhodospirillum rubrum TaxID=1085 RepID=UPI001904813F|nr:TetR/AcrR family transcriptional regulator [Rhodospirillum rubrum]MBK1663502.1 TetR family transcriptional regulator [Rhodospirillum rubrum]MBK1675700.1 TetR family transcriptional regulator [Rhodospirillum rubrum]